MIMAVVSNGSIINLKIGADKPDVKNRIVRLTASGEELDAIRRAFPTIPCPTHKKEAIWRGELAQFIYDNI